MKFYIKEMHNPQFKNPYYITCGRLTKRQVELQENPIYGENRMLPYDTKKEYDSAIKELIASGKRVN